MAAVFGAPFAMRALADAFGFGGDDFDFKAGRTQITDMLESGSTPDDIMLLAAGNGNFRELLRQLQDGRLNITNDLAAAPGFAELMEMAPALISPVADSVATDLRTAIQSEPEVGMQHIVDDPARFIEHRVKDPVAAKVLVESAAQQKDRQLRSLFDLEKQGDPSVLQPFVGATEQQAFDFWKQNRNGPATVDGLM